MICFCHKQSEQYLQADVEHMHQVILIFLFLEQIIHVRIGNVAPVYLFKCAVHL